MKSDIKDRLIEAVCRAALGAIIGIVALSPVGAIISWNFVF